MEETDSGILTEVRLLQLWNAYSGMTVTPFVRVRFFMPVDIAPPAPYVQFRPMVRFSKGADTKALAPTFNSVSPSSIMRVFRPLQTAKADLPIDVTDSGILTEVRLLHL